MLISTSATKLETITPRLEEINKDVLIGSDEWIGERAVMRDEGGHIVAALMVKVQGLSEAFHYEVLVIKESLRLIREVKSKKIIIELDATAVINALSRIARGELE